MLNQNWCFNRFPLVPCITRLFALDHRSLLLTDLSQKDLAADKSLVLIWTLLCARFCGERKKKHGFNYTTTNLCNENWGKNVITRGMCCINLLLNCSALPQKTYRGRRSLWSGLPLRFPSWRCWILSTSPRTSLLSTPRTNGKKRWKTFLFLRCEFWLLGWCIAPILYGDDGKGAKRKRWRMKNCALFAHLIRWLVFRVRDFRKKKAK